MLAYADVLLSVSLERKHVNTWRQTMILNRSRVGIAALLGVLGALAYSSLAQAAQKEQVLILFDRSGSMRYPGNCPGNPNKAVCGVAGLLDMTGATGTISPLKKFQDSEDLGQLADFFFWSFRTNLSGVKEIPIANPTYGHPNPGTAMDDPFLGIGGDGIGDFMNMMANSVLKDGGSDPPVEGQYAPGTGILRGRTIPIGSKDQLHV
jgi:hypothetical protein